MITTAAKWFLGLGLVSFAIAVAYGYSTFVTLWPGVAESWGLPLHVYYET